MAIKPPPPRCAHCRIQTLPCPLGDACPGTRHIGTPRSCTHCHRGRTCPRHGRHWSGTL